MIEVNKEIEVIAHFDKDGVPRPIKFRAENDEGLWNVYKVSTMLYRNKDKANTSIIIGCKGIMNDVMKDYELKFEVQNTKWLLYRI